MLIAKISTAVEKGRGHNYTLSGGDAVFATLNDGGLNHGVFSHMRKSGAIQVIVYKDGKEIFRQEWEGD